MSRITKSGYTQSTVASRHRHGGRDRGGQPSTPPASIEPPATQSAASATTSSVAVSRAKSKAARVTDSTFRNDVLRRYGIVIKVQHDLRTPYEHFQTFDPQQDPPFAQDIPSWYRTRPYAQDSQVWLHLDDTDAQAVARQYVNLDACKENEAAYSYRGKNWFFKTDETIPPSSRERINTTYFKLEWGPTPDGKLLRAPPQLDPADVDQAPFAFASQPDCTYWLTLNRMNPDYRDAVPTLTYALPIVNAVCPYLTIEFKRDNESYEIAENQLAVATALVLYNRVCLRCERLQACNVPESAWAQKDFDDIKHYSIGLSGSEARFYLATPCLQFDSTPEAGVDAIWRGCSLTNFRLIKVTSTDGVLRMRQWVNEIHYWGLGKYSEQFVFDIKGILVQHVGGLSRISLTKGDLVDWGLAGEE